MASIVISGDTSGSVTLQAPAVAGSTVLNLPATSGTIQTSGAGYTTNGVAYATSATGLVTGSALTFDGTRLGVGVSSAGFPIDVASISGETLRLRGTVSTGVSQVLFTSDTAGTNYSYLGSASGYLAFGMGNSTEGMRLTSTGLGIGTSSPNQKLDATVSSSTEGSGLAVTNSLTGGYGSGVTFYSLRSDTSAKVAAGAVGMEGASSWNSNATTSSSMVFKTINANTLAERARITSAGDFLVGTTSAGGVGFSLTDNAGAKCTTTQRASGTGATNMCLFVNPNGTVGTIQISGSSTSYNTSSDYRLKNTIAPMTGALAKVALLKPVTYKWNADGSNGEGFIAHELAEVVPDCVSGEKDDVETYVDEDGNEQTRPVYQGIDTSFLVATLTAAIQEQQALINTLTDRISVLENK